ncbi:MAG: hypothetical protein ABIQ39_17020 [Ilumatobacteraceae bacterium]
MSLRLRWPTRIALITLVVVVAGAAFVVVHFRLLQRGQSTPLTLEQIRDRYNQAASASTTPSDSTVTVVQGPSTTARPDVPPSTSADNSSTTSSVTTAAVAALPSPGVYVYTTTGRDSVDALNGDHHDYPATTTITVLPSGCGVLLRWDVIVQRWMTWQRCLVDDGVAQTAVVNFDQFFGQSQTDTYTCAGDPRPLRAAVGATWNFDCTQGTSVDHYRGVFVGTETLTIAEQPVSTSHVRVELTGSTPPGPIDDSEVTETWYLDGTDLIVSQSAANATSNSTVIGTVHYKEQYEIVLTKLTPLE